MPIKVQHNKEIHIYKGANSQKELLNFIESFFSKVPQNFILYYIDSDSDKITISCDEDIQALVETSEMTPKIFIAEDCEKSVDEEEFVKLEDPEEKLVEKMEEKVEEKAEEKVVEELIHQDLIFCTVCTFANQPDCTICELCAAKLPIAPQPQKVNKNIAKSEYPCSECPKRFISEVSLKKHQELKHSVAKITEQKQETEKQDIFKGKLDQSLVDQISQFVGVNPVQESSKTQDQVTKIEEEQQKEELPKKKKQCKKLKEKKKKMIQCLVHQEIQQSLPDIAEQVKDLLEEGNKKKKCAFDHSNDPRRIKLSQQAIVEHFRVICDGCEKTYITGIRYKCAICPDFDFCEECEETKEHNHPFLKIRRPELAPKMIIAALDEEDVNMKISQVQEVFPQTQELLKNAQQAQQVQTHVFEEMLVDNTVEKPKKAKKVKKTKKAKVEFKEKPEILKERQVNYAVKRVAATMSEVLGGNPENYFDLIEKNVEKTTEELIALVIENPEKVEQKEEKSEEQTQRPKDQRPVYDTKIQEKAEQIISVMGGDLVDVYAKVRDFPQLSVEEFIEQMLIGENFVEKKSQKQEEQTPENDSPKETNTPQPKEQKLKKVFSKTAMDKAQKIAEVLGGEAETYFGLTDSFIMNSANDLIEMLFTNPELITKHSSYK